MVRNADEDAEVGNAEHGHAREGAKLLRREDSVVADHRRQHYIRPLRQRAILISPPQQRQRWTDKQILPHVNWGDIFFDLFYVGAAYNLSSLIMDSPTWTGFLYFCGCFFPTMLMWVDKMYIDARFAFHDDIYHRAIDVIQLGTLATAVVHIRPVSVLSNPYDNIDMFKFSFAIAAGIFVTAIKHLEILLWVDGEPAARVSARRDLLARGVNIIWFLAAAVISGLAYYGNDGDVEHHDDDHYSGDHHSEGRHIDDHHILRLLAPADTGASKEADDVRTTDIPIWLCFAGWLAAIGWTGILLAFFFPGGGAHKRIAIPMNVEFTLHRYGEWIMLMLGESVLSLLIVDVPSGSFRFYVTFFAGVLSVILMQYLHFRSQPHDPDHHAMRRSKNGGYLWSVLMQVYSAALVLIGVSYKMLLTEYSISSADSYGSSRDGDDTHLRLLTTHFIGETAQDMERRILAGGLTGAAAAMTEEERRQKITNMFCYSLALTWVCLDAMILTHRGLRANLKRCKCEKKDKVTLGAVILTSLRVGLIVFIGTLSSYETTPHSVAMIGLGLIFAQVVLRVLGVKYFKIQKAQLVHIVKTATMSLASEGHHSSADQNGKLQPSHHALLAVRAGTSPRRRPPSEVSDEVFHNALQE